MFDEKPEVKNPVRLSILGVSNARGARAFRIMPLVTCVGCRAGTSRVDTEFFVGIISPKCYFIFRKIYQHCSRNFVFYFGEIFLL
jgi:hypothetical protein